MTDIVLDASQLTLDAEIQSRARGVVQTVVDEYAKAMRRGDTFPPIDVFEVGPEQYLVADGFHRVHAARAAGVKVRCTIHAAKDRRDAILFAAGANAEHGLRRTQADKKRAVMMLLSDEEWRNRAGQWIAAAANVSRPFVAKLCAQVERPEKVIGLDGIIRATKRNSPNLGKISERLLENTREPITFGELLEKLNVGPPALRSMIENARRKGHTVHVDMTPTLSDRQEHRLRAEIRDLNAAKKHLLDELEKREGQIEALSALQASPIQPVIAKRGVGEGKRRQGTLVMLLSDLHVEEPVAPEKVNGLNEYNLDIADRCIERCAEAFEYFANDPRWDIREGILAILGDTYSGYIHAELQETNFLSPVQAVLWVQERLEKTIRYILAHTKVARLIIVCHSGNHGRLSQKIRASTRLENSLEWLMYKTLAARFTGEPRIEFAVEEGLYTYVDVYDETLCMTHGDQFRYQGGVGGLLIPVRRGLNEIRKYRPGLKRNVIFCMGHFHERMDVGDIVINGCFAGGTRVLTPHGARPIESLSAGDAVFSRDGSTQLVEAITSRKTDELIRLRCKGLPNFIECTPNHLFWAVKGETTNEHRTGRTHARVATTILNEKPQWIPAEYISEADWLHTPCLVGTAEKDLDVLYAMGLFMAEGHTIVEGGASKKHFRIEYTMHLKEKTILEKVKVTLDAYLGRPGRLWLRPDRTTSQLSYPGEEIARYFRKEFGHLALGKKVPLWMFDLSPRCRQAVVQGWFDGDGCASRTPTGTTISEQLAWGMYLLACGTEFEPLLYGHGATKIAQGVYKPRWHVSFVHGQDVRWVDGERFLRVDFRRRELRHTNVYDLQVSGEHTYCVEGVGVHNSAIGPTPYSLSINAKPERRAQHLFLIDSARGKDAPTAPVWLPLK